MVPNHQVYDYYYHMSDSQNPINSIINNYQPSLTIIFHYQSIIYSSKPPTIYSNIPLPEG